MNTTTIKVTSLSQFRHLLGLLKTRRISNLSFYNECPYSITFTTRSARETNNILKHLHLSLLQPTSTALAA